MPKSMLERIESVIKDNIEAALPKGVSVDYHYAAVSVLLVLETPTEAMKRSVGNNSVQLLGWNRMIAAARD